jgi:hypothetical protein
LVAKVAFYLKESLGTPTRVLSKLMDAFNASEEKLKAENPNYIVFTCRIGPEEEPIKLGVPFRALEEQIEDRMSRADLYRDLPRGRKRRGWKREFLESLAEAAKRTSERSPKRISCAPFATIVGSDAFRRSPLPRKVKSRKPRVVVDTSVLVAGISGFREPFVQGCNASADVLHTSGNCSGKPYGWRLSEEHWVRPQSSCVPGRCARNW